MTTGFVEFEFDLPEALLLSLIGVLDKMSEAPLLPSSVKEIPEAQGVYMLLLQGRITYIGKTDAESGLRRRLERHAWTIQHRQNLSTADVTFKAVRIFVFTAMDLETQLIRHYSPVPWNNSGFGSNDPGRERDTTNFKLDGFDAQYPIDLDRQIKIDLPSPSTAAAVIAALKASLPYTLRVEGRARGGRRPHPDIEAANITLPPEPHTARTILEAVALALDPGWQVTMLPSRVIMYRETRDYPFGKVIARSGA